MSIFYYRTKDNICPAIFQNEINNDGIITTAIEYIRVDDEVNLTFAFASSISTAEETQLDVLLNAHICIRPDDGGDGGAVDSSDDGDDNPIATLLSTNFGRIFQYNFYEDGSAKNKWLEFSDGTGCDETAGVIPWDCKLIAITYSNERKNTDVTLEVRTAPLNSGATDVLAKGWVIVDARTGVQKNFPTDVNFSTGDKVGVYFKHTSGTYPKKPHVSLFFLITETGNTLETITENHSGDFGSGSYDD